MKLMGQLWYKFSILLCLPPWHRLPGGGCLVMELPVVTWNYDMIHFVSLNLAWRMWQIRWDDISSSKIVVTPDAANKKGTNPVSRSTLQRVAGFALTSSWTPLLQSWARLIANMRGYAPSGVLTLHAWWLIATMTCTSLSNANGCYTASCSGVSPTLSRVRALSCIWYQNCNQRRHAYFPTANNVQ